jgi:formylglycine-generating enzyme required for sulfatase activity
MNIEISPKEYEKRLNWDDAMLYCQLLVIDNKNDWRLPSKEELDYIYHSKKDFAGYYYWTSTEDSNNNYAWTFNLWDRQNWYDKRNKFYVRAVRNLKK